MTRIKTTLFSAIMITLAALPATASEVSKHPFKHYSEMTKTLTFLEKHCKLAFNTLSEAIGTKHNFVAETFLDELANLHQYLMDFDHESVYDWRNTMRGLMTKTEENNPQVSCIQIGVFKNAKTGQLDEELVFINGTHHAHMNDLHFSKDGEMYVLGYKPNVRLSYINIETPLEYQDEIGGPTNLLYTISHE